MKYPFLILLVSLICGENSLHAQDIKGQRGLANTADTTSISQKTIAGFRSKKSIPLSGNAFYVTDPGKQGFFLYDPSDHSSSDDSAITLVSANGQRFKRIADHENLNVQWFGATGNGSTDDWYAIQKGINYILGNPASNRTLYFPPGTYKISRPLLIAILSGSSFRHVSINLIGPANSKTIAAGYASITPSFDNTFAIGIQSGKGILIKDLAITGKFTFPNTLNPIQVDTLSSDEWTDGSSRENQRSPYAGIVIDPFSDSAVYPKSSDMYPGLHAYYRVGMSRGGSSSVQIVGCAIRNFVVGFMITPSNQQNGELIDVIDCEIDGNKVGYAMGQAQSKECHVERLKCWLPTHTLFDNGTYGFRHGDGAAVPMVNGVNIAGAVKQLCRISAASFGGSFRNVYAEGLFRLGYVGGPATVSFEDCELDFATQSAGIPYPDFYILGTSSSFHNCMLRLYPGVPGARLILSGTNNHYDGGVMNAPPVAVNIDNNGINPNPTFNNVLMYYSGGILGSSNAGVVTAASPLEGSNGNKQDPVYYGNNYIFRDPFYGIDLLYKLTYHDTYERTARLTGTPLIHTDRSNWTAYFKLSIPLDTTFLQMGDFIVTSGLRYQDEFKHISAPTYPVGIVKSIGHDTVYLTNLALGIMNNTALSLWADYFVNELAPLTGDIPAGSNVLMNVQGRFPLIGERPDIPMLPTGSFVTAVNPKAQTVSFSNANTTGKSYTDYTFMNGFPSVEMYSAYDLLSLQQYGKTLIGGSDFYRYETTDNNTHDKDYQVNGALSDRYRVLNTNIKGDTSLHKLKYILVSTIHAGSNLAIGTTAQRPKAYPNSNFRINSDSLSNDIYHVEVFDGKSYRQLAYTGDLANMGLKHVVGTGSIPIITSKAPGTTIGLYGNDINMQITVTTSGPLRGNIVQIAFASAWTANPIAVISSANSNTASGSSNLFCDAPNPAGLIIGGTLSSKGVYVFNIHVGQ